MKTSVRIVVLGLEFKLGVFGVQTRSADFNTMTFGLKSFN
jgi:hypothetical protein